MGEASGHSNTPLDFTNSQLRDRLAEIDFDIEELQAKIQRLQTARKPIVDALDAIVYPILTLPTEIISEIFKQHLNHIFDTQLEENQLPLVNLRHAKSAGPLFLSHVCRAWRCIAVNMPSLWCRVREDSFLADGKLLTCWLQRAGGQMLHLDLGPDPTQTTRLLPIVAPYSPRWRTFKCSLRHPISIPIDTVSGRILLLRDLDIRWDGPGSRDLEMTPITAFSDAPELRNVELHHFPPQRILLPWAQLTHLILHGQNFADGIEALRLTPNLEELCIDLHSPPDVAPKSVTLNHVQKLVLPDEYEWVADLLPYITLPRLDTLDITSKYAEDADAEPLITLLQRSHCALRSISLHSNYEFAISALDGTPGSLGTISIRPMHWTSRELAQFFTRLTSDSTFLPKLRCLEVLQCTMVIPYTELVEMLSFRRCDRGDNETRIESFRLERSAGVADKVPSAAVEDKLRSLMDDGLDIRIKRLEKSKGLPFNNNDDSEDSDEE
ncbi:F-box domain-containing protein [Favolaschia claudopus]|uniref:F-box domain-containing protein n=1 Tax=Favolaschia claudopus TaxID=2862362 RepID=A0AAW0EFD1_9AGAR